MDSYTLTGRDWLDVTYDGCDLLPNGRYRFTEPNFGAVSVSAAQVRLLGAMVADEGEAFDYGAWYAQAGAMEVR